MFKQQKGITLLNLVFVILVLLTLAAITIAMVLDEFKYDPKSEKIEAGQYVENSEKSNSEKKEEKSLIVDGEELINEILDKE